MVEDEALGQQLEHIAQALCAYTYRFANEVLLHKGMMQALEARGIAFEHEKIEGPNRFDFFCPPGIVIEVKVQSTLPEILRQADRYLALECCKGLILACAMSWARDPARVPGTLRGKPLRLIHLPKKIF